MQILSRNELQDVGHTHQVVVFERAALVQRNLLLMHLAPVRLVLVRTCIATIGLSQGLQIAGLDLLLGAQLNVRLPTRLVVHGDVRLLTV
jgi:hypothetical protein